jgi:hypothetical protein
MTAQIFVVCKLWIDVLVGMNSIIALVRFKTRLSDEAGLFCIIAQRDLLDRGRPIAK